MIRKLTAAALAAALLLSGSVTALAAAETTTATAVWRGVSIVLERETLTPADQQGNVLEPFILDGTTYLPVRAVAGALGLGVSWDAETSTVALTSGGETVRPDAEPVYSNRREAVRLTYRDIQITLDGETLTPRDETGKTVEPFLYNSSTYLPLRALASALGLEVGWDGVTSTVFLGEQPDHAMQIATTDNGEIVTTYDYDCFGHVKSKRSVAGAIWDLTRYTYDADGLLLREVYTNNTTGAAAVYQTVVHTYDANGYPATRSVTRTGSPDSMITYRYDAAGHLLSTVDDTGVTTYAYDANGELVRMTDEYDYGQYSGQRSETYTTQWAMEGTQTIRTVTTGSGAVTTETYDAGGRLLSRISDGETLRCTYNAAGNLTEVRHTGDPDYTITYRYDAEGRLKTETYAGVRVDYTVTYTWQAYPIFR